MEDVGNIFEKQVIGISKTKVGKPPTRLQNHAPASLKIDQMKAAAAGARTSPFGSSPGPGTCDSEAAATPIPLLTPLGLSPSPFPETEEFVFPILTDDMKAATPAATTPTTFGWKQPVGAAGYNVEASTLLALFQNKCVIVNDAQ